MSEPCTRFTSKTLAWGDLRAADVAPVYSALRRFALRLDIDGTRFAVNGILKRRFWVRRAKMWEYARGIAVVQVRKEVKEVKEAARGEAARHSPRLPEPPQPPQPQALPLRVLDFGGGATLPIFYLASRGAEVLCLDVDAALADWSNRVAHARSWKLQASTRDLTLTTPLAEWGQFDAVISFSVLEHIPYALQEVALTRLAGLLRPGGVMALTFDYGSEAAQPFAIRDAAGVERLLRATGLEFLDPQGFVDNGQRFPLDKRHRARHFTFASLMLHRPASANG